MTSTSTFLFFRGGGVLGVCASSPDKPLEDRWRFRGERGPLFGRVEGLAGELECVDVCGGRADDCGWSTPELRVLRVLDVEDSATDRLVVLEDVETPRLPLAATRDQ